MPQKGGNDPNLQKTHQYTPKELYILIDVTNLEPKVITKISDY